MVALIAYGLLISKVQEERLLSSFKKQMLNPRIVFSQPNLAEIENKIETLSLRKFEVLLKSRYSLISNGSEMGIYKNLEGSIQYPIYPGYTVIGEIVSVGSEIDPSLIGQYALADYPHQLFGVMEEKDIVLLQNENLSEALFARIGAVSMPSIIDSSITPTEPVLVIGLGIVGLMAVQILEQFGYEVVAIDRNKNKQVYCKQITNAKCYSTVKEIPEEVHFGLLLECTGNEEVLMEGITKVRKRGEVYLIGVPWTNYSQALAADLTREIFYRYITVRSGWEWFLPENETEYNPISRKNNLKILLSWLESEKISVANLYEIVSPNDCQKIYSSISQKNSSILGAVFNWNLLNE